MNSYCLVAFHVKHTRYMCVICALYVVTCRYMLNTKEMDSLGLGRLSPGQAAALPWPGGSSPLAGRQLSPGQAAALPWPGKRVRGQGAYYVITKCKHLLRYRAFDLLRFCAKSQSVVGQLTSNSHRRGAPPIPSWGQA